MNERVVLAHGCFDVLHLGHIQHLQEARKLGDRLVVSITPDAEVRKGPGRPVFNAAQRREALLALGCVDDVIIAPGATAKEAIEQVAPAIYVKGIDYENTKNPHHAEDVKTVEALGGKVHITRTAKWSSSRIINEQRLSKEAAAYLDRVRGNGWLDRINDAFSAADKLNILFVGETIIDEYRYVSPLAKPSKEFILATVEAKEPEQFLGGVIAASLHGEWKNTKVVTNDGEPLRKTRYVDADFGRKLFEVYSRQRIELGEQECRAFRNKLNAGVAEADVVVVLDFGHGLMDAGRRLVEQASFLAVNAQTNAGNYGFNPVTKYERADLVCIDEPEERLADSYGWDDMRVKHIIITRGRNGALAGDKPIPAFGSRAIDTMGAGDAFLAVTAPLVAAGLELEAAAFVGNIAGAIKTDIVGHRRHVGRDELLQTVEALLQ